MTSIHTPFRPAARATTALLAVAFAFLALAASAAPRPDPLVVVPGVVIFSPVNYDTDDTGKGTLVITIGGREFKREDVPFSNLAFDASGKLTGLRATLPPSSTLPLAPGTELILPNGTIELSLGGKLTITASGTTLKLPFRNATGVPITATSTAFTATVDASGKVAINLAGVVLIGVPTDGLALPGIKVKADSLNFDFAWSASPPNQPATWTLTAPTATVSLGLPGQATVPDHIFSVKATGLTVNQDAQVSFQSAAIQPGAFALPEIPGFDLNITTGMVSMSNSLPTFDSVQFNIKLPEVFQAVGGGRVTLPNVNVTIADGFTASLPTLPPLLIAGIPGLKLGGTGIGFDFSGATVAPGIPVAATGLWKTPAWMGLVITSGTLEFPVGPPGGTPLKFGFQNFMIGPQGVSGKAGLSSANEIDFGGFKLSSPTGGVELVFNQLKSVSIGGTLNLGADLGSLKANVFFDLSGKFAFTIQPGQSIKISPGITLDSLKVRGEVSGGKALLAFAGNLNISGVPGFKFPTIAVTDFKVDGTGKLYMPASGMVSFPDPQPMELGPIGVELRQFGFTTANNKLASIRFAGGVSLKAMEDILPVSGEIDFEGFELFLDGPGAPRVEIGGIEFDAEVLGVGKLHASLHNTNHPDFKACLYGDAELKLTCLGDMPMGIGLEFLVAPKLKDASGKPAPSFFVGGDVSGFAILVQIPPAGVSPPIPLFHIMGFSGGFGFNVAPNAEGIGIINDPITQLKPSAGTILLQAGLLLGDPNPIKPGQLWWGDAALTLTINPVTIDLTARASFLDMAPPEFLTPEEWEDKDRWAKMYINLDTATPALTIGGSAHLDFPTRGTSLLTMSGEAKMRVANGEPAYLQIGWKKAGQKPLKIKVADAISDFADISGECGLQVIMPVLNFDQQGRYVGVKTDASLKMYLDARADFKLEPVGRAYARLKADFDLEAGQTFSARGHVAISGRADFGLFTATAKGSGTLYFNTPRHRGELYVSASVRGSVGDFKASGDVNQRLLAL